MRVTWCWRNQVMHMTGNDTEWHYKYTWQGVILSDTTGTHDREWHWVTLQVHTNGFAGWLTSFVCCESTFTADMIILSLLLSGQISLDWTSTSKSFISVYRSASTSALAIWQRTSSVGRWNVRIIVAASEKPSFRPGSAKTAWGTRTRRHRFTYIGKERFWEL